MTFTRQQVIDALGEEHILGMNPRCEWLIQQIMVLVDAHADTRAAEAIDARIDALIRDIREDTS